MASMKMRPGHPRSAERGIFYCFIDDFYSGNSQDIKLGALMKEMRRHIDENVRLNVSTLC